MTHPHVVDGVRTGHAQDQEQQPQEEASRACFCPCCGRVKTSGSTPGEFPFDETAMIGWRVRVGRDWWMIADGTYVLVGSKDSVHPDFKKLEKGPRFEKLKAGDCFRLFLSHVPLVMDEAAYNRFWPLARQMGLAYGPLDFTDPQTGAPALRRLQMRPQTDAASAGGTS